MTWCYCSTTFNFDPIEMIECFFISHFPQMVCLGEMLQYFWFCFGKSHCNIREKMLSIIWSICLAVQRAQVRLKVNNYSRQWFEMLCVVVCVRAIKCTWFNVCFFSFSSLLFEKPHSYLTLFIKFIMKHEMRILLFYSSVYTRMKYISSSLNYSFALTYIVCGISVCGNAILCKGFGC